MNTKKVKWTDGGKFSLIDHCSNSKSQIFEKDMIQSVFEDDHFTIEYQPSLKSECKDQKTEYLMRDKRRNTISTFNHDIALRDWSLMYKIIGAN